MWCVQRLGFPALSSNPHRLLHPHHHTPFKSCWALSLSPRQRIPILRSHQSFYFDHVSIYLVFLSFFFFLSHALLSSVLYMTGSVYAFFKCWAPFFFELLSSLLVFFTAGLARVREGRESFQLCPCLNLLCAPAPPTGAVGWCTAVFDIRRGCLPWWKAASGPAQWGCPRKAFPPSSLDDVPWLTEME